MHALHFNTYQIWIWKCVIVQNTFVIVFNLLHIILSGATPPGSMKKSCVWIIMCSIIISMFEGRFVFFIYIYIKMLLLNLQVSGFSKQANKRNPPLCWTPLIRRRLAQSWKLPLRLHLISPGRWLDFTALAVYLGLGCTPRRGGASPARRCRATEVSWLNKHQIRSRIKEPVSS